MVSLTNLATIVITFTVVQAQQSPNLANNIKLGQEAIQDLINIKPENTQQTIDGVIQKGQAIVKDLTGKEADKDTQAVLNQVGLDAQIIADTVTGFGKSKTGCWLDAYGRGVGRIPKTCSDPRYPDKNAGLCYTNCKEGYKGVLTGCWRGLFDHYNRGIGHFPKCAAEQQNQVGLCYPHCAVGYAAIGPVCWGETCPEHLPKKCGRVCMADKTACTDMILDQVGKGLSAVVSAVVNPINIIPNVLSEIKLMTSWPSCKTPRVPPPIIINPPVTDPKTSEGISTSASTSANSATTETSANSATTETSANSATTKESSFTTATPEQSSFTTATPEQSSFSTATPEKSGVTTALSEQSSITTATPVQSTATPHHSFSTATPVQSSFTDANLSTAKPTSTADNHVHPTDISYTGPPSATQTVYSTASVSKTSAAPASITIVPTLYIDNDYVISNDDYEIHLQCQKDPEVLKKYTAPDNTDYTAANPPKNYEIPADVTYQYVSPLSALLNKKKCHSKNY
ncbi:hypothetical protein HDU92_001829 [Lobulomyces angularis]|nr:hypothetical protein HDU92_001829 [Lobulomyces angularis]